MGSMLLLSVGLQVEEWAKAWRQTHLCVRRLKTIKVIDKRSGFKVTVQEYLHFLKICIHMENNSPQFRNWQQLPIFPWDSSPRTYGLETQRGSSTAYWFPANTSSLCSRLSYISLLPVASREKWRAPKTHTVEMNVSGLSGGPCWPSTCLTFYKLLENVK